MRVFYFPTRLLALALLGGVFAFWAAATAAERLGRETVGVLAWVVAAKVIVVDPGHGGVDPGAVGPGGTLEKDLTLAVGKKLQRILAEAGATVILTRETDTDLGTPGKSLAERKREDLAKRVALAREVGADLYLSIQVNSFGTRWRGAQVFYHPRSRKSKELAEAVQKECQCILRNTTREAQALDSFVLRNLEIPAVMVEIGFLSNAEEEKLLNDPRYQEKLAFALYAGVVKYLAASH